MLRAGAISVAPSKPPDQASSPSATRCSLELKYR